jgi:subtilisin family serine protease
MRKTLVFLFLFNSLFISLFAQSSKMSINLQRFISNKKTATQNISVLIKGNPQVIKQEVEAVGGKFKYSVKSICSVIIPISQIKNLLMNPSIERMEGGNYKIKILDDATDTNANMLPVRDSASPLDKLYDGKGVVIGIIDGGIDITHPDFQNADHGTRIKYIWDQNDASNVNAPGNYGYGREWTSNEINSGSCTYQEQWHTVFTHGSNVSGIAAGNGLSNGLDPGIATKADIIVVSFNFNADFTTTFADAVRYVFQKADSLHEPCVINASLGTYEGSHDGQDLLAQAVDSLITEKSGHVLVCAAGNAGNIPFHLGTKVNDDTSFTWFTYNPGDDGVVFELYSNTSAFKNIHFSIGADNPNPENFLGHTSFRSLADFPKADSLNDTLIANGNRIGTVTYYLDETDSTYHLLAYIQTESTNYYWRFMTTGSGYFDAWNDAPDIGTSEMVNSNLPDSNLYPDFRFYKLPDTRETLISSYGCSDKVITVANYFNRLSYLDYDNQLYIDPNPSDTAKELAITSSIGPTRTGLLKPNAAAPGNHTLSACNDSIKAFNIANPASHYILGIGGWHSSNGGTSMASPVVTGIAALYLEKHPNASWKEVQDVIQQTCYHDKFTGENLPDTRWGYGKVDAFNVLTSVYGCTDPEALNYNSLANVNNDSCSGVNGIINLNEDHQIGCFPNPAKTVVHFYYKISNYLPGTSIDVFDVNGILIQHFPLTNNEGEVTMNAGRISAGIYFYCLKLNGHSLETHKVVFFH